jgi:cell division protein FtsI (penicillin-binding protein 3)
MRERAADTTVNTGRLAFVLGAVALVAVVLVGRAVDLHILNRDFLQRQGDSRHLRVVEVPAHRGMIVDRQGEPLAISTPVESVWINPQALVDERERWPQLARTLDINPNQLARLIYQKRDREFAYVQRHLSPDVAERVRALDIPGVFLTREYRRYYPTGEVTGHLLGATNVDDGGIEGVELMYDEWLRGIAGNKRVIKDRYGRIVQDVESISEPRPGRDLRLSIDRRIQYLAYRELKAAVTLHQARGGSAVVLDARTGEVLAMVNQPTYNPNDLSERGTASARNRAVTDLFEPGSTIKPFTVATALESGRFRANSVINTSPGLLRVGNATIHDHQNFGVIDFRTLLQKSSNVGSSLVALALPPTAIYDTLHAVGFGQSSGSGFPGEVSGSLVNHARWSDVERATLSYGYGMSVTPLQLAQAYTALAGDGRVRPASFVARDEVPEGRAAVEPQVAAQVRKMLEAVVDEGGTGTRARVPGYRIAGKTGTVHKAENGGYASDRYMAIFAGMAPSTHPRLVMVVMIDEPRTSEYYGGEVAAPVFGSVMAGALRLLDVAPDDLPAPTRPDGRIAMLDGRYL